MENDSILEEEDKELDGEILEFDDKDVNLKVEQV
jgi:hypothetical protein